MDPDIDIADGNIEMPLNVRDDVLDDDRTDRTTLGLVVETDDDPGDGLVLRYDPI
jgi:hypothetical protein